MLQDLQDGNKKIIRFDFVIKLAFLDKSIY